MGKPRLIDIADIVTGSSPDKRSSCEFVSFIQIKDFDPAKRALVMAAKPTAKRSTAAKTGDVLLAARGGQTVVAGHGAGDGLVNAYPTLDVYLIRADTSRVDPDYLAARLALGHIRHGLQASTTGSLISRIPISSLKALPVPLPSLSRQRAIGELFQLAHREAELIDRLSLQTRHLRARQIAAAFASLEASP